MTTDNPPSDDDDSQYTFSATPSLLSSISPPLSAVTAAIRRSTRSSLRNRLRSIYQDSLFVRRVSDAFGLPLVPNARAGDWYVEGGGGGGGGAYFKSTDGHAGQCKFSLRRLNLGVLDVIAAHDSTRRGKRFPDSLSKTVPIWIAVVNRVLFPERRECGINVNPQCVGDAEARRIEGLLDGFVENFLSLELDLSSIKSKLSLPLRPIWISPTSPLPTCPPTYDDFSPVVLLSASEMVQGGGMAGEYIQGAGDDHEAWAAKSGLTPEMFWNNRQAMLDAASEQDLLDMIASLSQQQQQGSGNTPAQTCRLIRPTTSVFVGPSPAQHPSSPPAFDITIDLSQKDPTTFTEVDKQQRRREYIASPLPAGKKLFPALRIALPHIISSIASSSSFLSRTAGEDELQILLTADNDHAALSVALTILSLYYDDAGKFTPLRTGAAAAVAAVDKKCVRKRLAWIAAACPDVQVPRGALNSVNSFLMKRP